ncbi:MAG TPA: type 2 lanthipeptide synthetase LanM [Thermoleophilaceae bacterium]
MEPRRAAEDVGARLGLDRAVRLNREPVVPELTRPVVDAAASDLSDWAAARGRTLEPSLAGDAVDWFRQIVARLTNLVVVQRFAGFHLAHDPLWRPREAPPGDAVPERPRAVLDAYVEWETREGLFTAQGPYPELARLLSSAREAWLGAVAELVERTDAHRPAIARLAGVQPGALGPLTRAELGISDLHDGGRSAAILSFEGARVVYKPRSLDGEAGWTELATDVIRGGLGLPTAMPSTAIFDGYGFMSYVASAPCPDRAGVRRCFRRYGALLALAHATGTCDLHHENVIVSGEHPTVVDAEPLLRARLALSAEGTARVDFEQGLVVDDIEVRESVLELGLLPLAFRSPLPIGDGGHRPEFDVGALCAYGSDGMEDAVPCGRGSDDLQMRIVPLVAERFPNLPELDRSPQLPSDHVDDLIEGFEAGYAYLSARRHEVLAAGGRLDRLATCRVRLIPRPTMDYSTLLARSLTPEALRSSEARHARVESDLQTLGRWRLDGVDALAELETASILQGDIPRFEVRAGALRCGPAALMEPPLESARRRYSEFGDLDRGMQVTSIRERLVRPELSLAAERPDPADRVGLLRHGLDVMAHLARAVRSPDRHPHWVYASYAPGAGATLVHADREALYEGGAGTALALAEAGRLSGNGDWRDLAVRLFDPLLGGEPPRSARRSGGMARGLGGLLYGMARVADATCEERLFEAATALALEYGPRLAREDALDEVLYGRAGLLLAVLALDRRRPDPRLRTVADTAANELLRRGVRTGAGRCWPAKGRAMPHVAHGSAGVAMALARWAAARGAPEGARAAEAALAFDDSFWRPAERGWTDARLAAGGEDKQTTWSWCNGRAGALLARASIAREIGRSFPGELEAAAAGAEPDDAMADSSPGLCCGTPGVVDALLEVRAQCPETVLDTRISAAINLLADAPRSHYSGLTASLFGGAAGLAFGLLRAGAPAEVPAVLAFA